MSRFEAEIRGPQHRMAAAALAGASHAMRQMAAAQGQAQAHTLSASPAVISAPPKGEGAAAPKEDDDDEDIFARLEKYEKDLKKEKKQKKKAKTSPTPSSATSFSTSSAPPRPSAPPPNNPSSLPPPAFHPVSVTTKHTPVSATIGDAALKKAKKQKRIIRTGGGQVWEDDSLKEWDPNDFRLFCGDLGNDVTDEVLARTFGKYPSFQKAKVIRDKRTNKTKGYGFVSFTDPSDFTKAVREINGKYVGSRPIKLRKSNWRDRNIDVVRQKQKVKQQMGYKW